MSANVTVHFTLNGRPKRVRVAPMKRLLDTLRDECRLTGAKEGCGEGECGACSALIDGRTVCSCLVPTVQAEGAKVVTVEGLAGRRELSVLQKVFLEGGAAQCGICTPGILITSAELLSCYAGRVPSDAEVREALGGNLCRCTGYQKIVDSIRDAARVATAGRKPTAAKNRTKMAAKAARKSLRKAAEKTGRSSARKTARRAEVVKPSARRTAERRTLKRAANRKKK